MKNKDKSKIIPEQALLYYQREMANRKMYGILKEEEIADEKVKKSLKAGKGLMMKQRNYLEKQHEIRI
jgi:hypothetical protein